MLHSGPVVLHDDCGDELHGVQFKPHGDVCGVGVQGVPDHLSQGGQRLGMRDLFDEVALDLDMVNRH
jgi:hypothetical protein